MVNGTEGDLFIVKKNHSQQRNSVKASVSCDERERAVLLHILKCHFPKSLLQKPTLILFVIWICDIMMD